MYNHVLLCGFYIKRQGTALHALPCTISICWYQHCTHDVYSSIL